MMQIPPNESSWLVVGAEFGMSVFFEVTLFLFIEIVGSELSILGPDPFRMLSLVK